MKRAAVGVSAHLGWAATATISVGKPGIRALRSDRIETAPEGDREAQEPFHVAGGFAGLEPVPRPKDPKASLQAGLQRQRRFSARELSSLTRELAEQDHEIAFAAILVSRGRKAASFEKSIGSHTQIHIEEGLAVRDSIGRALRSVGAEVIEIDTRNLMKIASNELGISEADLMAQLAAVSPQNGGSWRKEQRQAALAAWVAWRRCRPR